MAKPETRVYFGNTTGKEVTSYVRSVTTSRGKSRELDRFDAGQFSVVLDNRTRLFDPTNNATTTRTNLVKNPIPDYPGAAVSPQESWIVISRGTGGAGTTTLTASGAFDTVTTAASTTGYSFGFTGTTNAQRVQVTAGLTYAISFYATSSVNDVRRLSGTFYNAAGTSLGEVNIGIAQSMTAGLEMRFTGTYTAPANAVSMRVYAAATTGSVIRPLSSTMYWGRALVEEASTVGVYFSGDTVDTDENTYSWSGTAEASTSTNVFYTNPFYLSIKLRQLVRIVSQNGFVICGYITDWDLAYDVNGDSIATVIGADGFLFMANQALDDFTPSVQKSGARISAALARPNCGLPFFATQSIATGLVDMVDDPVDAGTNLLEYLQLVEQSERGSLFFGKSNALTFYASNGGTASTTTFTDTGSDIPYNQISVNYGSDYLYNSVNLENTALDVGTAENATSITNYGQVYYSESGLLVNDLIELQSQADVLSGRYGEPEYRFDAITIQMNGLTTAQQDELLGLELVDRVTVEFTPNKTGSQITKTCTLIGIDHQISIDRHDVVFRFASAENGQFILDDDFYGLLDYNLLG
jgi:hypothetical protein